MRKPTTEEIDGRILAAHLNLLVKSLSGRAGFEPHFGTSLLFDELEHIRQQSTAIALSLLRLSHGHLQTKCNVERANRLVDREIGGRE